ncbi:MAG TPA: hypothetical protein VFH99_03385 [Candidatus Saccharimonadales bacterium]|nr:hypothetical protein [Candidatus Saccharimonadales bacterium]
MSLSLFHRHKKYWIGLLLGVVVIIVGAKLFEVGPFHTETPTTSGASFNTKGEKKSSSQAKPTKPSGPSTAMPSTTVLLAPFGNFVSNHHPNLSGSPAPNTMSSVCNTTPGASCKIIFTKDGTTKELVSQTADANGSVYWNWKLQDIDLSSGSWKIQAITSLNGQTKTASDAMDLVVTQ